MPSVKILPICTDHILPLILLYLSLPVLYILYIYFMLRIKSIYSSSDKLYESHDKKGKLNLITSIRKHYIHVNILLQPKKKNILRRVYLHFTKKN